MADNSRLGVLESDVLRSLRELDEAPARAVRQHLETRGKRLAYTTVATTLGRLWSKGLVHRRRETCRGGERFVYRSVDFERRYLRQVLQGVVSLFGPSGVVHLNEELAKLDPGQERELRRQLRL
ncbi:MAG: BlaI/MecI/CopY family transcriptional regulator [Thermoplasmata archaeon]|nr:BlaI/MecI/CopY family transcriptional regulator [Thermoplasmata archaeon]